MPATIELETALGLASEAALAALRVEGHSLRMHCLYRIDRTQFDAAMQNRRPPS